MGISDRQQRYAIVGFLLVVSIHGLYFFLGASILGFYVGDLINLIKGTFPLAIITSLLLFFAASAPSRLVRGIAVVVSSVIVVAAHLFWPW